MKKVLNLLPCLQLHVALYLPLRLKTFTDIASFFTDVSLTDDVRNTLESLSGKLKIGFLFGIVVVVLYPRPGYTLSRPFPIAFPLVSLFCVPTLVPFFQVLLCRLL